MSDTTVNMAEIARIVREDYGITCWAGNSGGNVQAIYAGDDPTKDDEKYLAIAGPGYLDDAGVPTGSLAEFSISPDDDGVTDVRDVTELGAYTERQIARLIARQANGEDINGYVPFLEFRDLDGIVLIEAFEDCNRAEPYMVTVRSADRDASKPECHSFLVSVEMFRFIAELLENGAGIGTAWKESVS